jgi:hypothetical protein
VLDVFAIVFDGGADKGAGVGVAADEFGGRGEGEVEQVVKDEDLAVAIGAGSDADGGDGQLGGDGGGHLAGNAFEDDSACPGFGEGVSVGLELVDGLGRAGLDAIAAHAVEALRSEAEVADDGNLCLDEGADKVDARPFDLDGFGSRLFDEASGVGKAGGNCGVAAEGHIRDDQSATNGAAHGAGVVKHFIDGDGESVFVSQDHHGQRIADQDEGDASFVGEARRGVIVGGECGDRFGLALHLRERGHGDFCDGEAGGGRICACGEVGDAHVCLQCRSVYAGCDPNKVSIRLVSCLDALAAVRGSGAFRVMGLARGWSGLSVQLAVGLCRAAH